MEGERNGHERSRRAEVRKIPLLPTSVFVPCARQYMEIEFSLDEANAQNLPTSETRPQTFWGKAGSVAGYEMNKILEEYLYLTRDIDRQTADLRAFLGDRLCPPTCYACCVNTATLLFAEVEGMYLKQGLEALPTEVRKYVLTKAKRAILRMASLGYTTENMVDDAGNKAIDAIKGSPEAQCPMLVGGVCVVYKQRPVICRIWGYPMFNGDKVACCNKTFRGKRDKVKPLNYIHYWRETKRLSQELGAEEKTPNCYMVVRILEKDDVPIVKRDK